MEVRVTWKMRALALTPAGLTKYFTVFNKSDKVVFWHNLFIPSLEFEKKYLGFRKTSLMFFFAFASHYVGP